MVASALMYDALDPLDSINTYMTPDRATTAMDNPNALRMFICSLIPNFDPVDPEAAALPDGMVVGVGDVPRQGTDLRNSGQQVQILAFPFFMLFPILPFSLLFMIKLEKSKLEGFIIIYFTNRIATVILKIFQTASINGSIGFCNKKLLFLL